VNTYEKRMIIGTKRPPESCSKTQVSQVNRKTCSPNLSRLLSVIEVVGGGGVDLIVQYDKITYRPARLAMQNNHPFRQKMPFHFRFHFHQKNSVSIFVFIFSLRFRFFMEKSEKFPLHFYPYVRVRALVRLCCVLVLALWPSRCMR
jgi:hypothetical protein